MKLPPLNSIKAFECVARLGSINAAAKELSVSHGAVSQQLKVLEQHVGRDLFLRTGNAVQLTAAALPYAKAVRKALKLVSVETARLALTRDTLRLRISVPPTFAVGWLIPRLPRFHQDHPDIEISLDVSAKVALLGGVGPHAAVRFGNAHDSSLTYLDIYTPDIVIAASPKYLARHGLVRSLHQLRSHRLIGSNVATHAHLHVAWSDVLEGAPPLAVEVAEAHLAVTAAIEGLGLVLVEDVFAQPELLAGRLSLAFAQRYSAKAAYRLAMPRNHPYRKPLGKFAQWLKAELQTSLKT